MSSKHNNYESIKIFLLATIAFLLLLILISVWNTQAVRVIDWAVYSIAVFYIIAAVFFVVKKIRLDKENKKEKTEKK